MSNLATVERLASSPLLHRMLPDDIAEMLGVCAPQELAAGEVFCQEGDGGDALAIVGEGKVEVFVTVPGGGRHALVELGPGGVFGEMSFLDGSPRSASVRALEATTLFTLTPPSFAGFAVGNPHAAGHFYRNLARLLADRLRTVTRDLRSSIEWSLRVSGASTLGLNSLMGSRSLLDVTLDGVGQVRVQLLQVSRTEVGPQLLLGEPSGAVWLVPYGAVRAIKFVNPPVLVGKQD
jgi:CRP-like cAMP-binding protein